MSKYFVAANVRMGGFTATEYPHRLCLARGGYIMIQMDLQLFRRIDALRFYSGDIRERCNDGRLGSAVSVGGLYSDRDAYRTLNALLFPGVENEKERIWQEEHKLNPVFIDETDKTVQIYTDIFTLMKDKRQNNIEGVIGKRVDRVSFVDYYLNGFTQSYFSCSKTGYDSEFGRNKIGIVLFEVELSADTPCVDLESILPEGEYKFSYEKEILLPPFLSVICEKVQMTHSEKKIRDKEGKSPMGKYRLKAGKFPDYRKGILVSQNALWQDIMDGKVFAAELLERLNGNDKGQDYTRYIVWKEKLQTYLKVQFSDIWYGEDRN